MSGQFIDVPALAVLGANGTFRDVSTPLNPTNLTPPFFQVWDSRFLDILGPSPSVRVISERDDFAFAHEVRLRCADIQRMTVPIKIPCMVGSNMESCDRPNILR